MYNVLMMLLVHIFIALASIVYATYTFFRPTVAAIQVSYAFIAATIGTGTLLIIFSHANVLHTCLAGLAYTAGVSHLLMAARRKLALQQMRRR